MHTNIQGSNTAPDLELWRRRCRKGDLRVDSVHLRSCHTDTRERNRVVSWIAVLEMRTSIVGVMAYPVMLVDGQSMVVFRMIVIAVEVWVQRRHNPDVAIRAGISSNARTGCTTMSLWDEGDEGQKRRVVTGRDTGVIACPRLL